MKPFSSHIYQDFALRDVHYSPTYNFFHPDIYLLRFTFGLESPKNKLRGVNFVASGEYVKTFIQNLHRLPIRIKLVFIV